MAKKTPKNYLTKFDEINRFTETMWIEDVSRDKVEDYTYDQLVEAYLMGMSWAEEVLNVDDSNRKVSVDTLKASVSHKTNDLTPFEMVGWYYDDFDEKGVDLVLSTEFHRVFNEGSLDRAKQLGCTSKQWVTVKDNKVRFSHEILEGVKIPINEKFESEGDSAYAPGGFNSAEQNCNCRCILKFE